MKRSIYGCYVSVEPCQQLHQPPISNYFSLLFLFLLFFFLISYVIITFSSTFPPFTFSFLYSSQPLCHSYPFLLLLFWLFLSSYSYYKFNIFPPILYICSHTKYIITLSLSHVIFPFFWWIFLFFCISTLCC